MLLTVGDTKAVPRSGFGPRLIYLVGGYVEGWPLSTVELYDPRNASRTQVASMPGPRALHGCVALSRASSTPWAAVEPNICCSTRRRCSNDPQTDGWQPLAKMTTKRALLGLAAVGGKVYAIGGWDGNSSLDSVEAYDPQLGALGSGGEHE